MNSLNNLQLTFGGLSIGFIIFIATLGFLVPLFIAGIYSNTKRIEKHLRKIAEAAEARPRIIEEQVRSATREFERAPGSIYPEPRPKP